MVIAPAGPGPLKMTSAWTSFSPRSLVSWGIGNSNALFFAHGTLGTALDTLDAALEVDSGQLGVDDPDEVRLSLAPSTVQP